MTLAPVVGAAVYTPVAPPIVSPRPYGLFSVASPSDAAEGWQWGIQWASVGCATAEIWNDPCVGGTSDLKTADKVCYYNEADSFVVYLLGERSGPGADVLVSEIGRALLSGEERAVEGELWARMSAAATALPAAATELEALASAEAALADGYAGQGVIHLSPYTATILAEYLEPEGDRQYTKACNTPVVVGAGYGAGVVGSGPVAVYRGEVTSVDVWNREINDAQQLAERAYTVAWDCLAVKATVT
jgi:hypothetical protein